jgi:hypothetical protein
MYSIREKKHVERQSVTGRTTTSIMQSTNDGKHINGNQSNQRQDNQLTLPSSAVAI